MAFRPFPTWLSVPGLLGLLAALVALPASLAAQGCGLGEGSTELKQEMVPGRGAVQYFSTPHFVCEDGVEIWADSAVAYQAEAMSVLIGRVRYEDGTRRLTSDQARYFTDLGRLQAQGHVRVVNSEDGSSVQNGDLVYLRQTDRRAEEEMTVTTGPDGLRPKATIPPPPDTTAAMDSTATPDSAAAAAEPPEPYTVVADRMIFRGSSYFTSVGSVEIERDSLFAFADSAEYEEDAGGLVLVGSARVESASYDLVGRTITLGSADENGTSEVEALHDAVLTGENLHVTAPTIRLYLTDGTLDRLVAVPIHTAAAANAAAPPPDSADAARPMASAEDFDMTADSVEVAAPAGVVETILAAGRARSESHAQDSLNVASLPPIARTDWLEGDTIKVWLTSTLEDSAAAAAAGEEATRDYEVDRIVARVGARSLYRLLPQDSMARAGVDKPAVHYVMGDTITIHMSEGEVEEMQVVGQTRGVHLEPLEADQAAAEPDSAAAPPAEPRGVDGDDPLGRTRPRDRSPATPRDPPGTLGAQPGRRP